MDIALTLSSLATRGVVRGATEALGIRAMDAVIGFLKERFADQSQRLSKALQRSNERAWRALEIALAGDSWWERCQRVLATGQDRAFREQVQAFLDVTPLAGLPSHGEEFRIECLRQLRSARQAGLLDPGAFDPQALAEKTVSFARFGNPQKLLEQDWQAVGQIAAALRAKNFATLADFLELRPADAPPLLTTAVRSFFRREVERDPQLFQGLAFAQLEKLQQDQEAGFAQLADAFTEHGRRLEELLADVQVIVTETHGNVLDIKAELQKQGLQLQELGQAVLQVLQHHQLESRQLDPSDSQSIRNDTERKTVRGLIDEYRSLPQKTRRALPALLNAMGKLEAVAGNFESAQRDFEELAGMVVDPRAQAEAHANAFQAALEQRDWESALQFLLKAAELDAERFGLFPAAKFAAERILGAGGFGVAFLCRNRLSGSRVVIKSLRSEGLDRDLRDVFREAQALEALDHPAIIRLRDCDYADAKHTRPYIVMDYFEGATLHDYVADHGPLASDDAIAVAALVAEGLQAAHAKGILHRDVKPGNLLVRATDRQWQVKVIDFGLALRSAALESTTRSRHDNTLTGASIAGTVDYAAPEQMGRLSGVPIGPYSDVYGFGKTCCYALFQTPQPTFQHWKQLAPALAELLSQCLAEEPSRRPQDFAAVLKCLQQLRGTDIPVVVPLDEDVPVARLAEKPAARTVVRQQPARTMSRPRREETRTRRSRYEDEPPRRRKPRRGSWAALLLAMLPVMLLFCCLFPNIRPSWMPKFSLFPPPPPPAEPIPAGDIPKALAELKTATPTQQYELARRFAVTPHDGALQPRVAEAMEGLLIGENKTRAEAASALAIWGRKESTPLLIKLVNDSDGKVRQAAIGTLGKLKVESAAEVIAMRLPDGGDRETVVASLRSIGPSAEKFVIPFLKQQECRREAAAILKDVGSKKSLPALQEVASCGDHFAEQSARDAIRTLGGIRSWEPVRDREIVTVIEDIKKASPHDQEALLRRFSLTSPMPEFKHQVVAVLSKFAAGDDDTLRRMAVRGLVKWEALEGISLDDLLPLGRDRDEHIRHAVIVALAKTKDPRAAEVIAAGLEDLSEQRFVAERLKEMGNVAEKAVIPYLTKGNIHNQGTACTILAVIGGRDSVDALQKLTANFMLKRHAEDALRSLGAISADEVVGLAETLPTAPVESQLNSLRRLNLTPPVDAHKRTVSAALESLLTSASEGVRLAALQALAAWGDKDSVPLLAKSVSDKNPQVRARALEALAAQKDERGAVAAAQLLVEPGDRRNASAALQAMGRSAEKAVIPYLKMGDRDTQVEACNILEKIGGGACIPALQEASNAQDEVVKFRASEALTALLSRGLKR